MADSILLVEDDENDVFLIKRALGKVSGGSDVHVARDGEQAVDYLSGEAPYDERDMHPLPALVLLDLKLPRKSGLEVLEWVKGQPNLRRLPVVVLTSSRDSLDINRAYDLGANSYLVKPVTLKSLTELLRSLDLYWMMLNEKPEVIAD